MGAGLTISEWNVVGPFAVAATDNPWVTDISAQYSLREEDFDRSAFEAFSVTVERNQAAAATAAPSLYNVSGVDFIDFQQLFSRPYIRDPLPGAVYVACAITADITQEVYLLLGSADGNKTWLNGKLVGGHDGKRGVSTFDDVFPVSLKRGENLLVIKVCRWGIGWGLTARIEPSALAAAKTALAAQGMRQSMLLKHSVLAEGAALELQPRGVPAALQFPASITRVGGQVVKQLTLTSGTACRVDGLRPGIYRLTIRAGDNQYAESLCVGEPRNLAAALSAKATALSRADKVKLNVETLLRRMTILTAPESLKFSSEGERYGWERKIAYTLDELECIIDRLNAGEDAFANVPGLHLRAFRSMIDGEPQHYRIYIPTSYRKSSGGIPLIVMLPTVISASRPFIASAFMAAHSEAERICAIAERLDAGVLWPGYRNRPTGSPCEATHLDEAIDAVMADYSIDRFRITLLGACSGGALATMQVVHNPNRFAGIALLNPVFALNRKATIDPANPFYNSLAFKSWPTVVDATPLFFPLAANPVLIIHDGAEPGHGDLATSEGFTREALEKGHAVTMLRRAQTLAQHFGAWDELMTWAVRQRNPIANATRSDAFYLTPHGKISGALVLSQNFVVVVGTEVPAAAKVNQLAAAFTEAWTRNHFGGCRVVLDRDFDAAKFRDSNLVLFGNAETNSIWRSLAAKAPFPMPADAGATGANDFSFQAVFPHPDDANRYVLLIGARDLSRAVFGTQNLSIDGWYNFALWRNIGGSAELIEAQ